MDRQIPKINENNGFINAIIVIVIIGIAAASVLAFISRQSKLPDIVDTTADSSGNIVYLSLENEKYSIVKVDKDGNADTAFKLPSYSADPDIYYSSIVVDYSGNYYLMAEEDGDTQKQFIDKYDSRGDFVERIFEEKEGQSLINMQYINGRVIALSDIFGGSILLMSYDTENSQISETVYEFKNIYNIYDIIYDGNGGIYFTTADSQMYYVSNQGEMKEINIANDVVPYRLSVNSDKNIVYFNDIHNLSFCSYDGALKKLSNIHSFDDYITDGVRFSDVRDCEYENGYFLAKASLLINGRNMIAAFNKDSSVVIEIQKNGVKSIARTFIFSLSAFAALGLIAYIIFYSCKKSGKILVKIIVPMAFIVVIASLVIVNVLRISVYNTVENEVFSQLYIMSSSVAKSIDGDELKEQKFPQTAGSEYYEKISHLININMDGFYEVRKNSIRKDFYYTLYYVEGQNFYIGFDVEEEGKISLSGTNERYMVSKSNVEDYFNNTDRSRAVLVTANDITGEWMSCPTKIYDSNGVAVGYIDVGTERTTIEKGINELSLKICAIAVGIMTLMVIILAVTLRRLLKGIGILKEGVSSITDGNWNATVVISSNDEIEDIGNAFNKMSFRIKRYLDSMIRMNGACKKFIPDELFKIIGKQNIVDINIGDQKTKNMNIVSITTRNFYDISKSMTNQQQFAFLNNIFGLVSGIIEESGGVVESYQGYGMRAIFRDEADEALNASIKIFEVIQRYNKENDIYVDLGISIQNDDAMVGIVGNENRMSTAVVSDSVNFIYELEKFTTENGINLIITKKAYERIKNKEKYCTRYIGKINKGKSGLIDIYDCIDACDAGKRQKRIYTKNKFEKGVNYYISGNLKEARKNFIDVLKLDKEDKLTKSYIFLCDNFIDLKAKSGNLPAES